MNERPTKEFLAGLVRGQTVRVTRHNGDVTGRISDLKPRLIFVRIGKEIRRFLRQDGGTFQVPDPASRSWILPIEEESHA